MLRYRCHRFDSANCNARLKREGNQITEVGDHSKYHGADKQYINNLQLSNAVKERCLLDPRAIKDIFDEETLK